MKQPQYSPAYVALITLLHQLRIDRHPIFRTSQENGRYQRDDTGLSAARVNQEFYVSASELWQMCTAHEWYLVGRISSELKRYNCLWLCSPDVKKSSSNWKAINGLLKHGVLMRTETANIYMVNPIYIRRGEILGVINTTADLLSGVSRVTADHVRNCKPVSLYDVTVSSALLGLG